MNSWDKIRYVLPWLPSHMLRRRVRPVSEGKPVHLVIAVANHFEPSMASKTTSERCNQRAAIGHIKKWCRGYINGVGDWLDEDGKPLRHTYFYPAEEYDEHVIDYLAEFCHSGWGEIEIHLHHGVTAPDTSEKTRAALVEFRDALAARGCLSLENGAGEPRYAFVHGNWALANSAQGRFCGVDDEMQILAETGCYADLTLPAPSTAQVRKINALYECAFPLNQRAPHREGIDLRCGKSPEKFPLIVQGPLSIFGRRKWGMPFPGIENAELSRGNPPTMKRLERWMDAGITVKGKPDWLFIKLHCHGMNPGEEPAMFGLSARQFLQELVDGSCNRNNYHLHFVTAREMVNIILAACDQRVGNPGRFRDYRFQLIRDTTSRALVANSATNSVGSQIDYGDA